MKHLGNTCEYIAERDEALYREVIEQCCSSENNTLTEAMIAASMQQTKRFWISEERAREMYHLVRRGKVPKKSHTARIRLYNELYHRINSCLQTGKCRNLSEAVEEVVNSPAPEYYLSPATVKTIFHRQQLKMRRNLSKEKKV